MNSQEKALLRKLFRLKIHESDGDTFESLFSNIMFYAEPDFQQIKPWGNIGDRKNDGYIKTKGIYYQVYAPEDIRKSYPESITKLKDDFAGLIKNWTPVNEFYFLINDKFQGVSPDAEQTINKLVSDHGLTKGKIMTAKDLESIAFNLDEDKIYAITGFLPDLNSITRLDYSVVNEVVKYIMELPIDKKTGEIKFPDWGEKIKFNELSPITENFLNFASQKLGALNQYLSNETFLAEELQTQMIGLYEEVKKQVSFKDEEYSGDYIFWEMVKKSSPKNESLYESSVITIISKYFESCDIFEEPKKSEL